MSSSQMKLLDEWTKVHYFSRLHNYFNTKAQQNMAKMYEFLCALLMVFLTRTNAKVLLVSMDGFRWDYINKAATPNFDRMAQ